MKKMVLFGLPLAVLLMAFAMMTSSVQATNDWWQAAIKPADPQVTLLVKPCPNEVDCVTWNAYNDGSTHLENGQLVTITAPIDMVVFVATDGAYIDNGVEKYGLTPGNKLVSGFTFRKGQLPTATPTGTSTPAPTSTPTPDWYVLIHPITQTISLKVNECQADPGKKCFEWNVSKGYVLDGATVVGQPVWMQVSAAMNGAYIDNGVEKYGLTPGTWLVSGFTVYIDLPTPTPVPTVTPTSQPTSVPTATPVVPDRYKVLVEEDDVFINFNVGQVSGTVNWGDLSATQHFTSSSLVHRYAASGTFTITSVYTDEIGLGNLSISVEISKIAPEHEPWYDWIRPVDPAIGLNFEACEVEVTTYGCVHWDLSKGYTRGNETVVGTAVEMVITMPMEGSWIDAEGVEHPGLTQGQYLVSGFTFRRVWPNFLPAVRK